MDIKKFQYKIITFIKKSFAILSLILIALYWIGFLGLGFGMLMLQVGIVGEFVGPIIAWLLVVTLYIPFSAVLPLLAYIAYGGYEFPFFVLFFWFFSIFWSIIGPLGYFLLEAISSKIDSSFPYDDYSED